MLQRWMLLYETIDNDHVPPGETSAPFAFVLDRFRGHHTLGRKQIHMPLAIRCRQVEGLHLPDELEIRFT